MVAGKRVMKQSLFDGQPQVVARTPLASARAGLFVIAVSSSALILALIALIVALLTRF